MIKHLRKAMHSTIRDKGEVRAKELVSICAKDLPEHIDNYLDIGIGLGYNTKAFGIFADSVIGLDISIYNKAINSKDAALIKGSGQEIPLKNNTFNLITSISVIEHVPDKTALLKEAMRVLKPDGQLVIQFPNRYFFMELHSGIPLFFYFPKRVRAFLAKKGGSQWVNEIDIPSIWSFRKLMRSVEPNAQIKVIRFVYSVELMEGKVKTIYKIMEKMRIFKFVPMGYLLIISK